jgi:type I restriction enzyme M protein
MPPRKKKADSADGEVTPRKKRQAKTIKAVSDEPGGNGEVATRSKRKAKSLHPVTSKQRLSSIIKRVRDKLREDAGISTDAERLPQLTWMLFLKFLDDHEKAQEEELGHRYVPVIEAPYRWRDWATPAEIETARKGDDLLVFVNTELFEYLRKRSGGGQNDLREVVGKVFRGTYNLVRSGYILREVVELLSGINFNSSDDVHVVSHFYETMLKEMRDASGKSGEFYTPRPLIRLIIDRLAPKLGDHILDPACGTCGFLVEAYERLKPEAKTPAARLKLQQNLIGIEKKAMPYLLGVVNLLLHGVDQPSLDERNTLASPIRQIKDSDRVEVIATNPPFGGEEEEGILNNFPDGMKTKETAVLFFQFVMARLKRGVGRCGIVLPNGFLFGTGVANEVKKQLLQHFRLHTVIRLPEGIFLPYTNISTNVLFFEAGDSEDSGWCTKEIWYYQHPLPEDRKYSKSRPLEFQEFQPLLSWWDDRVENERAWKVPFLDLLRSMEEKAKPYWEAAVETKAEADRILNKIEKLADVEKPEQSVIVELRGQERALRERAREQQGKGDTIYWSAFNLDLKNPRAAAMLEHLPPEQLVASIVEKEQKILAIMGEIETLLQTNLNRGSR